MSPSTLRRAAVAAGLLASAVSAKFDASSTKNIAMYWGQGASQIPLSEVCADPSIDIVNIGFVNGFPQNVGDYPSTNHANACWGYYPDPHDSTKASGLLRNCNGVEQAIKDCQTAGKKVLLSLGGGYPTNYYLPNQEVAEYFADFLLGAFGPLTAEWAAAGKPRPWGAAAVDGFDLDLEADETQVPNKDFLFKNYDFFGKQLKLKQPNILISGAPQCVVADARLSDVISKVPFDFIFTQFYNTYACSAKIGYEQINQPTTGFSFDKWVQWLQTNSYNKNVKLYLGLPAGPDGLPVHKDHYLKPEEANALITKYQKKWPSVFGGVMLWEATVSAKNPTYGQSFGYWMKAAVDGTFLSKYHPVVSSSTRVSSSTKISSSTKVSSSSAKVSSSTKISSSSAKVSSSSVVRSSSVQVSSSARSSSAYVASSTKVSSSSAKVSSSVRSSSSAYVASSTVRSSSAYVTSSAKSSSVYSASLPASSSSSYLHVSSSASVHVSSSVYPASSPASSSYPAHVSSSASSSVYVPHPSESSSYGYPASSPSIVYPADTTKIVYHSSSVYPSVYSSVPYPAYNVSTPEAASSTPCTTSSKGSPAKSSSVEYPAYPAKSSSVEYPAYPAKSSSVEYPAYPAKSSSIEYPAYPAKSSSVEYPAYPAKSSSVEYPAYPAKSSSVEYPAYPAKSSSVEYPAYPASSKGYGDYPPYPAASSSKGYSEYPASSGKGYESSPSVTKKPEYPEYPSYPTATTTTVITTTYVDVCSTGLTTITYTYTKTVGGPKPTKEPEYPEGWTTSVYVDKTVTVTITKPVHPATDVPAYPSSGPKDVYPADYPSSPKPSSPSYGSDKPSYPVHEQEYPSKPNTPEYSGKPSKPEYPVQGATSTTVRVITLTKVPVPYTPVPYPSAPAPYVPAPHVPAGNGTSAYAPKPTGTGAGKPTKPTSYSPPEFTGAASRFGVGMTAVVGVVAGLLVL